MPKHSQETPRSSSRFRSARTSAIAAVVVVTALSAGVVTAAAAQSARADVLEQENTLSLVRAVTDHSQLDVYDAVLTAHTAYQDRQAAQAAYLATPAGAQDTARALAASQYGWGEDQFGCLVSLWERESNWNVNALNASSGATGIPQALPGEKMASAGADWQTNPATQIAWGLGYIAAAYGTPCSAWGHSESYNWY